MAREATDMTVAGGAVTTPMWVQHVEQVLQPYMILAATVLVTLRVIVAALEIIEKRKNKKNNE